MSSKGSPYEASQSGQGGGCGSSTGVSCRDQGGGGGAGLRVESAIQDSSSIKTPIADSDASSLLKTDPMGYSTRKQWMYFS